MPTGRMLVHRLALRAVRAPAPRARGAEPRLRITFLMFFADVRSGVPRTVFTVAGGLAERHDVEIVSMGRRRRLVHEPPPTVRIRTLDDQLRRRRARTWKSRLQERLPASVLVHPRDRSGHHATIWSDALLLRHLRRLDADVVVSTRFSMNVIAARLGRAGIPAIGQEHQNLTIRSAEHKAAMLREYGGLHALVVLTEDDRRNYQALLGDRTRVVRIPNAAPAWQHAPSDLTAPVVIAMGRMTRQKAFPRLVRAFALAPGNEDWVLRICGRGRTQAAIEQVAARRGVADRVQLPGFVRDVPRELQNASIFALSSRFEGFPMVLLEAMSIGLPIVAFDCPTGPSEMVVDGENGFLVPNRDLDAFAEALGELMRDPVKRRRFGANGLERVRTYSQEAVDAMWDDVVRSAVAARQKTTT